ncbi:MAG: hypothetical protein IJY20_04455 [Clostridia bacterium]|nr:hypothetical protein [Clostridia bacterium]
MKKFLSFFLVLCMLISAVPALLLPVFAEDTGDDEVKVLAEYSFIEEFAPGITYTVSENEKNNPIGGTPFASNEEYLEWLLSDGVFAVGQGDSNWKVGEYDVKTGVLDLFSRLAFGTGDTADGHDMNWVVTESVYERLATNYVESGSPSGGSIWNGNGIWHLHAGSNWKAENGIIEKATPLAPGRITTSGTGFYSAIQYTVAEKGTYGVQLGAFSESATNGHVLAIMVNGEPVWPLGAQKTNSRTWYSTATATLDKINTALIPLAIKLNAGDKVSFVVGNSGDAVVIEPIMRRLEGMPIYVSLSDPNGPNTASYKVAPNSTFVIPTYQGDNIFFGWDSNGDGAVDYGDGAEIAVGEDGITLNAVILEPSKFYDEKPYWDETAQEVVFPGDWSLGVWDKTTGEYLPVQYHNKPFITPVQGGPWNTTGGGMYDTERPGVIVSTGTLDYEGGYTGDKEEGNYITAIQYTAAYNGTVSLDFEQFIIKRELNTSEASEPAPIQAGFAVYVDGEKVWPEGENEYYWFSSADVLAESENGGIFDGLSGQCDFLTEMTKAGTWPFPLQIEDVSLGSVIDIRAVRGNPYNWGFYLRPTATFTALDETPTVSHTSVDIAEDFTLNIYANVLGIEEGSGVGMEYWTSNPSAAALMNGGKKLELIAEENGLYKFAYAGLTAKQMTDTIYVRAYTTDKETGEEKAYGTVEAVSIQQYAMAAMGQNATLDNLLIAMLNYGSEAQTLFGYKTDNRANALLDKDQRAQSADVSALVDSYSQSGEDNKIKYVSLLLGTDIGMKYVIDVVEGAETYELEYSKNADFTDSTKIPMTLTKEGLEMKAIYNISFSELQDVFYVRVIIDGEEGATLTYSVESYVLRISDECSDGMYNAAMALAYLGQALEAYKA